MEPDVCVVGSGAGGAPVAWALSRAGMKVVVLEKGPHLGAKDFARHDEIGMCRRDFWVPLPQDDPHVVVRAGQGPKVSNEGWIAQCVGGGTVHMSGFFFRLHPDDFQQATRRGRIAGAEVADWPITYRDLEPFYDEVEAYIGLSAGGPNPFEAPRRLRPPNPPVRIHPAAGLVEKDARGLGWHPFQTCRAVLSQAYRNRPACSYCAFCGSYGCEHDAKSDVRVTFLAEAAGSGRCEIRDRAAVEEVTVDAQGRASGVVYRDAAGQRQRVTARAVVLACSAVETARLLLNSRSARFPDGLANSSGLVGRNLMFSTFSGGRAAYPASHPSFAASTMQHPFLDIALQDFYAPKDEPKAGTVLFLLPHPNPIHHAERLAVGGEQIVLGSALKKRLRAHFLETRQLEFETFGEYLPTAGSRVELDDRVKDRRGVPAARIVIDHHPDDLRASRLLQDRAVAVLDATRPLSVERERAGGESMVLQMGTCRMGNSPQASVLDPSCRAHDVPNLWVSDSSSFPSSGGVPITLTILANALRVGRHIADRAKKREL